MAIVEMHLGKVTLTLDKTQRAISHNSHYSSNNSAGTIRLVGADGVLREYTLYLSKDGKTLTYNDALGAVIITPEKESTE